MILLAVMLAAPVNHYELGRRAYRAGDYEQALHEMMLTVIERPKDARAREYMRLAGERLIEQDLARAGEARRGLLKDYRRALAEARNKAEVWNGWVAQSRAEAGAGRWARSFDDAQRVLDENPLHQDAREARRLASIGLARVLSGAAKPPRKDWLVYRGLFLMVNEQPAEALETLESALREPAAGELEDERVKLYAARLTPKPVEALPPPAAAPPAAAPRPRKAKKTVVAAPKPGQWAYSQGLAKLDAGDYAEAADLLARAEAEGHELAAAALARARQGLAEGRREAARLYSLGLMLYGQGRRADAVERWRRAVKLDPEHGYAARALAHAEQELAEEAAR